MLVILLIVSIIGAFVKLLYNIDTLGTANAFLLAISDVIPIFILSKLISHEDKFKGADDTFNIYRYKVDSNKKNVRVLKEDLNKEIDSLKEEIAKLKEQKIEVVKEK